MPRLRTIVEGELTTRNDRRRRPNSRGDRRESTTSWRVGMVVSVRPLGRVEQPGGSDADGPGREPP